MIDKGYLFPSMIPGVAPMAASLSPCLPDHSEYPYHLANLAELSARLTDPTRYGGPSRCTSIDTDRPAISIPRNSVPLDSIAASEL